MLNNDNHNGNIIITMKHFYYSSKKNRLGLTENILIFFIIIKLTTLLVHIVDAERVESLKNNDVILNPSNLA